MSGGLAVNDAFARAFAEMPLVAVLRGIEPDEVPAVADALMNAGFRLLEVPLNSPSPFDSIAKLVECCPPESVVVGAGTVVFPKEVERLAATGARLMVTPNTDPATIEAGVGAGLVPVIGCMTPSEAFTALRHGARVLKIFPAARLGPAYLKDARAVLPKDVRVITVGGIGLENMEPFHAAGADGYGFGANLYAPGRPAPEVGAVARDLVAELRRLKEK
jgi:2-dehydro-3-deoxyphosphogalactonate aldolase